MALYESQQLIKVAENKALALKNEHTNWKHQIEMRDLKCRSKRLEIKALKHQVDLKTRVAVESIGQSQAS